MRPKDVFRQFFEDFKKSLADTFKFNKRTQIKELLLGSISNHRSLMMVLIA
jgi:hypothetical protein